MQVYELYYGLQTAVYITATWYKGIYMSWFPLKIFRQLSFPYVFFYVPYKWPKKVSHLNTYSDANNRKPLCPKQLPYTELRNLSRSQHNFAVQEKHNKNARGVTLHILIIVWNKTEIKSCLLLSSGTALQLWTSRSIQQMYEDRGAAVRLERGGRRDTPTLPSPPSPRLLLVHTLHSLGPISEDKALHPVCVVADGQSTACSAVSAQWLLLWCEECWEVSGEISVPA